MRVLICGDRNWRDKKAILREVLKLPVSCVIEGECRGADLLGMEVAEELGIDVLAFPAQWDKHGRAAGPIRNQQMLEEGKPDMVLAFHADLDSSRGTADMVRRARKAGVPVKVVKE